MLRSRIFTSVLISALALMLIVSGVLGGIPSVALGSDAPTPTQPATPEGNGGKATWTVSKMNFTSNYPTGFTFDIEAESTGGKITSATAFFRHSPETSRVRAIGKPNEAGNGATAVVERIQVPQWVQVEYWWILTDEAGNSYETPRAFAEYEDNTRKWGRLESEDIVVFWEEGVPDEIGQMTVDAMKQMRDTFKRRWANPLGYVPRAIIYASYDTWEEWSPRVGTVASSGGVSTRIAGRTDDTWAGTAQMYFWEYGPEETAYNTVTHEVGHLYQYANGGATGDFWFFEGNATFFEVTGQDRMLRRVRQMAADGTLPSLQAGGPSARGAFARDAYDIGFAFWVWLEETYGPDAHRLVWVLVDQGRGWKNALETVTNLSFIDMETTFRTWLGAANPVAPSPVPSPTLFFFPSPTYEPTRTPKP